MYGGNIESSFWQRAHVGFAPYLANFDELNTWLLLRVDHHPAKNDHFVVTPVLRVFLQNNLAGSRIQQQQPRHGQLDRAILKEGNTMRHIVLTLVILAALSGSALAETIHTTVHGMVCAFCATGIEKTFRKQPEVATVKVDLRKKP